MIICNAQILSWDGEGQTGKLCEGKNNNSDWDISCLFMVYAINVQQSIYSAKIVIDLQG